MMSEIARFFEPFAGIMTVVEPNVSFTVEVAAKFRNSTRSSGNIFRTGTLALQVESIYTLFVWTADVTAIPRRFDKDSSVTFLVKLDSKSTLESARRDLPDNWP